MSDAKRRDNKGRVLHVGEAQMEDGRYMYRYKDPYGKRKTQKPQSQELEG